MKSLAHWLFKEEPSHYSYEQLEMDGSTVWDGVKNNLALKNLRTVKKGDLVLYYHTGDEKCVVGICIVTSARNEGGPMIEIKPLARLRKKVTLQDIRVSGRFADSALIRMPRLSVMPVTDEMWQFILERGETSL